MDQRFELELGKEPAAVQWLFEASERQCGQRRCILWHTVCEKYVIPLEGSLLLPALQFAKL